jgi:c-di-AMP phosphodiesterase-like protein
MVFAVIVFQILMIGIFALKKNATVSALSIPPVFVTIIFYIFINMYWTRIANFMELTNFSKLDDDTSSVDEKFLKVFTILAPSLSLKVWTVCGKL